MKKKMPIYGVGPLYVIFCLLLTILASILNYYGHLDLFKIEGNNTIFLIISIFFIIIGIFLWFSAVIYQKIGQRIKEGKLVTDGIYKYVRNPIYSAFIFIFTGIIVIEKNFLLYILPFIYWLSLTILMKNTEEKWLKEVFQDEYIDYCKKVNRIIPWISIRRR